jgi:hypothetical protein
MRPLVETDTVPVLARGELSAFEIQLRTATNDNLNAEVTLDDGVVITAIVLKEKGPEVVTCPRKFVLIDDQGGTGCYYMKQRIIAFAKSHTDAVEYASIQREKFASKTTEELTSTMKGAFDKAQKIQSEAQDAFESGKGTEKQAKVAIHALLDQWANCGNTSENLRQLLVTACGLKQLARTTDIKTAAAFIDAVEAALTWEKPLFIDVSLLNIHTFSLELHLDGGYLVQGYQGAYTAFWWQGVTEDDVPLKVPGMKTDEHVVPHHWATYKDDTLAQRVAWGKNKKLSRYRVCALLSSIADLIRLGRDGNWTPATHQLFVALPFYPGQSTDVTVGSLPDAETVKPPSPISVDITVREILDVEAGYKEFGGSEGSLCHLALNQLSERMIKLALSAM